VRVEAGGGRDFVTVNGRLGKPLTINGGSGNDVLSGTAGAETINGGAGHDVIRAFPTAGTFNVGDVVKTGVWTLTLGDTDDVGSLLTGGRGDDTIVGSPGHDTIQGDAGRDVFQLEFAAGEEVTFPNEGPIPQGDDDLTSIELTLVTSADPQTIAFGELKLVRD
jgi:Ca2+-binding RTX toxin-like protein